MNTSYRLLIVLLCFSTSLQAKDLKELEVDDFSRFLLLNEGTGENEGRPGKVKLDLDTIIPDPRKQFQELEIEDLSDEEKETAKKIALEYVNRSLNLHGGESIVPQCSWKLNEDIKELGNKGSRVWQVVAESKDSKISAIVLIHSETKKVRIWGSTGEEIKTVEPSGGHNSGSSAASIVTPLR